MNHTRKALLAASLVVLVGLLVSCGGSSVKIRQPADDNLWFLA